MQQCNAAPQDRVAGQAERIIMIAIAATSVVSFAPAPALNPLRSIATVAASLEVVGFDKRAVRAKYQALCSLSSRRPCDSDNATDNANL